MEPDNIWATEPSSVRNRSVDWIPIHINSENQHCPDCEDALATSYCSQCCQLYCDQCWEDRKPHKTGRRGHVRFLLDGSRMKDPLETLQQLAQALNPKWTEAVLEDQHCRDYDALWFGITHSDAKFLSLEAHPRFSDLMEQHQQKFPLQSTICPRIVSFVGGTGAGKSTLIQMLIRQLWEPNACNEDPDTLNLVPIVGAKNSTIPTSSDVHLYHDPIGDKEVPETPLLFADCEGFDGAGQSAAARTVAKKLEASKAEDNQSDEGLRRWAEGFIHATMRNLKRSLSWSQSAKILRQHALEQLFPRVLYNVSDVIVYVITETEQKKIGKVLQQLIEWSERSVTAAINRAFLPFLIVVMNHSDPSRNDWDPEIMTAKILEENQNLGTGNVALGTDESHPQSLDPHHCTLESALKCSYTSVKFICIPRGNDLTRLSSQLKILRQVIGDAATQAHNIKAAANMLLGSEHQTLFHQLAFEHFSKYEDKPFDFMETFFSISPLPASLANNLVSLLRATQEALTTEDRPASSKALAELLLKLVIPVIASAISIDICRSYGQLPGSLFDIIRGDLKERQECNLEIRNFSYEKQIETAIDQFLRTSCQCGFVNSKTKKRCVNRDIAHLESRPHQDALGNNIGFGTSGLFEPDLFHQSFMKKWEEKFSAAIASLDFAGTSNSSSNQAASRLPELWRRRKESIRELYNLVPDLDFPNDSMCFWCLRGCPTERLPCGHWICESCIFEIGESSPIDDRLYLIRQCDRHPGGMELDPPFEFLRLCRNIGQRLLCLDDGGVSGIVELVILDAVQQMLGNEIPLRDCFDLIGGTGAGGIIALGLALGQWGISEAKVKFKELASRAFSERTGWRLFQWLSRSTYKPENLEESIALAFGTYGKLPMADSMSNPMRPRNNQARVFVTTSVAGRGGEILTNYRNQWNARKEQTQHNPVTYTFSCALRLDEAARATFSFPDHFDPFQMPGGDQYSSGGAFFRNPMRVALNEAQYIWPQESKLQPDILLTIGSGCYSYAPASQSSDAVEEIGDCANAEAIWSNMFGKIDPKDPARYVRLCSRFKKPPPNVDNVHELSPGGLEQAAAGFLTDVEQQTEIHNKINERINLLVRRLISTTFYFHQLSPTSIESENIVISGHIRCRFKDTSDIIKAFGKKIGTLKSPRFVLKTSQSPEWIIDQILLDDMTNNGNFSIPMTFRIPISSNILDIKLTADDFSESISGCPFTIDSLREKA